MEEVGIAKPQVLPKETINKNNTTIIGDYVAGAFSVSDSKWLVQAFGNATFESIMEKIQQHEIIVDRKYIFIILGHNQLWSSTKKGLGDAVLQLVLAIHQRNVGCRIYFSALLP